VELLHALLKLANQLQSNLDLDAVVQVIATAVSETFGFREASVYVHEDDDGVLVAHAVLGRDEQAARSILDTPCPTSVIGGLLTEGHRIGTAYFVAVDDAVWTPELRACFGSQPAAEGARGRWRPGDALLVPLYGKRRQLSGMLKLGDPLDGERPTLDTIVSLGAFATHAAVAIENAREHSELQDVTAELEEQLRVRHDLLDVSRALLSTLEQEEVFGQIAHMVGNLVPYDSVAIGLVDEETGGLGPAYVEDGAREAVFGLGLPPDQGLAGWVVRTGQAALVNDALSDPRTFGVPGVRGVWQASIVAPLQVRAEVFGVLALARFDGHTFAAREFELAQLFANLAAVAIENARTYKEMQRLATIDGLTGMHNYRHFREALASEVSRADRYSDMFCLLMMDLDHFKAVNDTVGHQQGDEVLRAVAGVLRQCSRESDYLARYGGEEFVMVLPRTSLTEARNVAERIRAKIREIDPGSPALTVSMSIGVAQYPDSVANMDAVLRAADAALLRAKAGGRNRVCLAAPEGDEVTAALDGHLVSLGRRFAHTLGLSEEEARGLVAALAVCELAEATEGDLAGTVSRAAANLLGIEQGSSRHTAFAALLYGTERWDGDGYPEGLAGRAIPKVARVLAVVHRYDQSGRVCPESEVDRCLMDRAGSELDPHLVHRFVAMLRDAARPGEGGALAGAAA